jgi:hypothetical protein
LEAAANRLAAASPDIEVSGTTATVGHREDLVRAQQPEGDQRDRDTDDAGDQDSGRGVDGQVHTGQGEQRDDPGDHTLAHLPQSALRDEGVQDADEPARQHRDRRQG